MAKFTLPTYYTANYVLPKKRNPNPLFIKIGVDVEIRELDPRDVPIVFSVYDGNAKIGYRSFGTSDGSPCLVRKIDDKFYAKRWKVDEVVSKIEECAKEKDWQLKFNNVIGGNYKDDKGYVTIGLSRDRDNKVVQSQADAEEKFGPFRKWEDESFRTINAIKDRCDELFVIDGWVYEQVGEPVIAIEGDYDKDRYTLQIVQERDVVSNYQPIYDDRARSSHPRFGLDELERARDVARSIAAHRDAPFDDALRIELHAPWEVRFRGESELILRTAENVAKVCKEHLREIDANFGLAWHDLVSSMYVKDSVTPKLIDALQRMAAMGSKIFKRDESGRIERAWEAENESGLVYSIAFAMNLWNGRNHRGFEWTDESLQIASTCSQNGVAYEINSLVQASQFAEKLGVRIASFDDLTSEAAAGRGHLIAVEDKTGPLAAIFVVDGEDGPEAVKSVTRHGSLPSPGTLDLALLHARTADASKTELAIDLDMCGI